MFLLLVYFLEQSRQIRMRRFMSFAANMFITRSIQMQIGAIKQFHNMYRNRRAWVYHRQANDFETYYEADLNSSKDLDPKYWQNHYRIS